MSPRWPLLLATALLAAVACVPRASLAGPQALFAGSPGAEAADIDGDRDLILVVDNPLAAPPPRAGSNVLGYGDPGQYRSGQRAHATLAEVKREYQLSEITGWPIKPLGVYCVVLRPAPGADRAEVLAALARDPRVRIAEPVHVYSVYAGADAGDGDGRGHRYNDPYVGLQRGFAEIDAALAQQLSQGKGVDVAVVDTGVDVAHPDLAGRIRKVHDMVGSPAHAAGGERHGTEVAGVIAAVGDNHQGIVGVAPKATLSVYKACWQPEAVAAARCNTFTLAKALAALAESDARIINLSLGGPEDALLERLLELLLQQDRIVVAALPPAGRVAGFPATTPGVLVVGSAQALALPRGVIAAPGVDILTTQPNGRYDFATGSSLAAAHVSGIAALLLSLSPGLDRSAFRGILSQATTASDGGRVVNAAAALGALGNLRTSRLAGGLAHEGAVRPGR